MALYPRYRQQKQHALILRLCHDHSILHKAGIEIAFVPAHCSLTSR
jgi:hypothetical protein